METSRAVKCLAALAQESRLRIFRLLVRCGPEGLAAGQIAEQLEIPSATLSFHLKELTHSGLISQTRQGRSIVYGLERQSLAEFLAYLTEDCCQGQSELCTPPSISRCEGKNS
jgi:DNA-binding transcriptional ArsR family regulator